MSRLSRWPAQSLLAAGLLASGAASAGFLEDLACPLFGCADGPAPRVELQCRVLGLTAEPTYRGAPSPAAAYALRGACSDADHSHSVSFEVSGSFLPDQHDPGRPNASEIISITSNDRLSPDTRAQEGGAGYTEHVIFGAFCDKDPWLNAARCTRIGDDIPDALHATWGELPTRRFPLSAGAITAAERYRLRGRSDEAFGVANAGWREEARADHRPLPGQAGDATYSESATHARVAARDADSIRVEVRYPMAYGYRDAQGLFDAGPNSCGAFAVSAVPGGDRDARQPRLVEIAVQPRMRSSEGDYVCDYLVPDLPEDLPITVQVRVAGDDATRAWRGGSQPQPGPGERRVIEDGSRTVTLVAARPSARLAFRMDYRGRFDVGDSATREVNNARHSALTEAIRAAAAPEPPICASARSARARNSPAAPGLERQCREQGGTP